MNNKTGCVSRVDVGTPPSGYQRWELAEVCFHGFADLPSTRDEKIDSPEFTCLGHQWCLIIYPDGDEDSDDGMVAVYLCNMSTDEHPVIDFFFTVRDLAGKEVAHFAPKGERNNSNFAKRSTIMAALVEGTLAIEVRMRHMDQSNTSAIPFIPKNPLCNNILRKFMDEESADVVFEVSSGSERGEKTRRRAKTSSAATFHAHRFILQDGAPTLAELCKPGGGDLPTVPITDVKPDIFRHMLFYLYGGKVSDEELKANAKDLIDAADKFGVVSLKLEAEVCYVKSTTLTIDNILDNLLYADSKNCALLKETVMDFMVKSGDDIIGKVSFDNVPGSVVMDLLTAVARGKKKDNVNSDSSNFKTMRVGTLRRMLHDKGLDVDGSREAMIALLKENSLAI